MNTNFLGNEVEITKETVYKKAVRWVLLAGAALMPLFFLPWTTSVLELNKQLLIAGVAGAGLVLWLLDVVMSGKLSWRFNPLDKGVLALAVAVALSTVFSVSKYKSLMGMPGSLSDSLLTVASLTVIYLLIVNSFDDNGGKIRNFFSISMAVALTYGLLQVLGVHALSVLKSLNVPVFNFTESRAFNTFGSVNALGMAAAVMLPMLYKAGSRSAASNQLPVTSYLLKIGAIAALAVLVIINWWMLWAVAITGMVVMVAFESLNISKFKVSRFLFPMTVMVLGVFLMVVGFNLPFVKKNLPAELAPSQRLSAKVARAALQKDLVFGYGPENFSLAFDQYGAAELRNSTLSGVKLFDSISYVFNTAVHNGLVGLAALGFLLWLLVASYRSLLITKSAYDVGVISSGMAALAALFLYPFNTTLTFIFYLLLALLVLAVLGNQKMTYNVEEKASVSLVSSLGFIAGLIAVLVGSYFISLNYVADVKYAQALGQNKAEDALQYVVEAINWNGRDDRYYRFSSQLALALLSQELNTKPAAGDTQKNSGIQNYLSFAVTLAQKATQVAPEETNNWVNLGNTYQNLLRLVNGADTLAEAAYIKASELRPGDPSFQNRIGSMYLFEADLLRQVAASGGTSAQQLNQQANASLLKAEDAFKQAIELSNNFGLAIYNLGSVYERQGKLNEAIKQLEIVAPFNGNQPGLAFELGLLYYRANRKDKALEQLQKAVVLSPDYANARWYLALLYEERKQIDQAVEQLERILGVDANKDNQLVVNKLKELKSGKVSIPPAKVLDQKPL